MSDQSSARECTTSDKPARVFPKVPSCLSSQRGLSLLELLIVVAILMSLAAISLAGLQRATQAMRLQESAISYSNLLQQARIRAVHDDRYYTILTTTGAGVAPLAFIDIAGTGVYAPGDPMMVFAEGVSPMPFGSGPSLANLEAQFLPPGPGAILTVNSSAPGPSFGPRGLPCTPTSPGPTGTCPYLSPAGVPTSYISFLQNTRSGKWQAVTVTPAGRIRQWQYSDGRWSSLN